VKTDHEYINDKSGRGREGGREGGRGKATA